MRMHSNIIFIQMWLINGRESCQSKPSLLRCLFADVFHAALPPKESTLCGPCLHLHGCRQQDLVQELPSNYFPMHGRDGRVYVRYLPSCIRPRRAGLCGCSPCSPAAGGLGRGACRSGRWTRPIWGGFCAHSMQNSCIHTH